MKDCMYELKYKIMSIVLILFFCMSLYPFVVFQSINYYNYANFMIYSLASFLLIINIYSLRKYGIKSYNVFPFFYLSALLLNTLNISNRQLEKEYMDLYFYFIPFIATVIVFYVFDRKVPLLSFSKCRILNVNLIYCLLIFLYIALRLYIGNTVGYRLFSFSDQRVMSHGDDFVMPGFSGASMLFQWVLLILSPYVKKRYVVVAILAIVIFSVVLHVKRGDLIRILIFYGVFFVGRLIQNDRLTFSKLFYFFCCVAIAILVFTKFGEYRLEARGGEPGVIIDFLGSRVDSVVVAWLYGYLSFNFEVLKVYSFNSIEVCSQHISIFNDLFSCGNISAREEVVISGFNASTYLGLYARDYGIFLIVPVLFLSLFIGLMLYISKLLRFWGLYAFILTFCILMVFGDYWVNRAIISSTIFSIMLFPFLKINKDVKI